MSEVFGKYKDIMRRIPDLSKAKALLGYAPRFTLEDSVLLTIAEMRKNMKP